MAAVSVSIEPWPVCFKHADAPPEGGYTVTRLAQVAAPCGTGSLSVIFLHGAGAGDGVHGWDGLWRSLLPGLPPGSEVLLPSGPLVKPMWVKEKLPVPSWLKFFNVTIDSFNGGFDPDTAGFIGLDDVAEALGGLVTAERRRGRRIALGGFSQGAAMALWAGLAHLPSSLSAVFGISGYLPQRELLPTPAAHPPVLLLHGDADEVIPVARSRAALETVQARGWTDATFRSFEGLPHRVCRAELQCLTQWLCEAQNWGTGNGLDGASFGETCSRL